MQILLPLSCSVQRYAEEIVDVDRYRPDHCPQCEARDPLTGHGFYWRTLVDVAFDGIIGVRRYLQLLRKDDLSASGRCVAVAPFQCFGDGAVSRRSLAHRPTLLAAARAAAQATMPYQRGQFWIRRFQKQAPALSLALAALAARRPQRTSSPEPCGCSNPSDGLPPIASCFGNYASICWAGPHVWLDTGDHAAIDFTRPTISGTRSKIRLVLLR